MKHTIIRAAIGTALVAAAVMSSDAAQPNARLNPLSVSMVAAQGTAGGALGAIEITITNNSRQTVRIPTWELPSQDLDANLFQVSRDGQPVRYEGRLVKRALPTARDFTILRAGESYRALVDLSASYDIAKSGYYTVALLSPLQHASTSGAADAGMLMEANGLPMLIKSAPLRVWIDGNDALGAVRVDAAAARAGGSLVNGITYQGCTTSRMSLIDQAVTSARSYTENAKGYLNAGNTGARYTTWFGSYTASRYNTAKQHFTAIDSAMDQNGGQITVNCGCTDSSYAYVYPNQPYKIYVCNAFWSAPNTGTDSKAGTLIHEMSHFTVVAGTDDRAYGQSAAKNLARTNPAGALDNADSHEYFSENTPFQN